jgi:alanyl-tRNA synthetase
MVNKLNEIRQEFLDYFAKQKHQILASAPLIPHNDPSLMFINAGMVQFKNIFTGLEKPKYQSVTTSQKCVRAGGKHNDLENVGYTARHHTFFEMLGNFSFGAYFKEEAIKYAWDFVIQNLALPKDKLWVTVYHTDEDAYNLWQKIAGLPKSRIVKVATDDNFWSMGATGPCGPCSEIFYDHGEKYPGKPPGSGEEGDRFIEIWNLVFMQYEQLADGTRIDLPKPSIDTGMGLERIAAIMQGKQSNYQIDLFQDIIATSQKITKNSKANSLNSHYVIADHLRSAAFLLADGVMPSNEGRGYVLRRIMRRAMRHTHQLGYKGQLLTELFPTLRHLMADHYKELNEANELILSNLKMEEEKFSKTLEKGLKILEVEKKNLGSKKILSGATAFKLYDTYGFPLDLTLDILRGDKIRIDQQEFDDLMQQQRKRAKESWVGSGEAADAKIWFELAEKNKNLKFTGYQKTTDQSQIIAIIKNNKIVPTLKAFDEGVIITKETPFYAEAGGQIGDIGIISNKAGEFKVTDTQKFAGMHVHIGKMQKASFKTKDKVTLSIDAKRRQQIKSNHSATHLLQKSLQNILGSHVTQKGSYVSEKLLRFDFTNHKALSQQELEDVEDLVNMMIRQNSQVEIAQMAIDAAKKKGAMALFGEKYEDEVRVLSMGKNDQAGDFSIELCGGIHVASLGEIGLFKIIQESSIASGIRRIEALTGRAAFDYLRKSDKQISHLALEIKSPKHKFTENFENLLQERRDLKKHIVNLENKLASFSVKEDIYEIADVKFITLQYQDLDMKSAREIINKYQQKQEAIILLIANNSGKVAIVTAISKKYQDQYDAVTITKLAVSQLGGNGGGGRADFAQGGANDATKIPQAIEAVKKILS